MAAPDPTPYPLDHLALRGQPEAPALVADGRVMFYADLDEEVGRTAAALVALGLAPGALRIHSEHPLQPRDGADCDALHRGVGSGR